MKIFSLSKYYTVILLVLLGIFAIIYSNAGFNLIPNWDEEASVDIALGIRAPMVVDENGLPVKVLHYETIIRDTSFTAADYERYNNPAGVINAVMQDNSNSVLYYLALHYWIRLTGFNNFGLRLFTILTVLINLLLIARITAGRLLPQSKAWALAAVIMVAINTIFFSQAFMIRGYMLCLTFLLLATIQWLKIIMPVSASGVFNFRTLLWHAIFCTLAMFTHYFAIAIIIPQFIYLLLYAWRNNSHRSIVSIKPFLWIGLSISIFLLPLAAWYFYARQVGLPNLHLLDKGWLHSTAGTGYETGILNNVKQLFTATALMLGFDYTISLLTKSVWQSIAAVVILLLVMVMINSRKASVASVKAGARKPDLPNPFLYCWLMALVIYSVRSWLSGHFMMFERKYLIFLVPFLLIGLIWMADWCYRNNVSRKLVLACIAILTAVNIIAFVVHVSAWRTPVVAANVNLKTDNIELRNAWQEMPRLAKEAGETFTEKDTIVYAQWKTAHLFNYFLRNYPGIPQRVDNSSGNKNIILLKTAGKIRTVSILE